MLVRSGATKKSSDSHTPRKFVPITREPFEVVSTEGSIGVEGFGPLGWYDFAMQATFSNPHGILDRNSSWTYGFIFHRTYERDAFDVLFVQAGQCLTYSTSIKWHHKVVSGAPRSVWSTVASGGVPRGDPSSPCPLDTHTYGSNKLSLSVQQGSGSFVLNGTTIAQIRTDTQPRGSGLVVVTCIFSDGCQKPASVTVTDLFVSPTY